MATNVGGVHRRAQILAGGSADTPEVEEMTDAMKLSRTVLGTEAVAERGGSFE